MGAALTQAPDLKPAIDAAWLELDPALELVLPKTSLRQLLQKIIEKAHISLGLDAVLPTVEEAVKGEQVSKTIFEGLYFQHKSGGETLPDLTAIRQQVEYYLSDTNLKNDKFFNDLITRTEGGYIPMDVLLKCKKLKALTQSPQVIAEAVAISGEVELKSDKSAVRRVNNRIAPILASTKKTKDQPKTPEPATIIMRFSLPEESKSTWKDLRDAFRARFSEQELWYVRLHDSEGHIGLPGNTPTETVQVLETEGLTLDGQKARFHPIHGDELLQFWKDHGSHYDLCNQQGKKHKGERPVKSQLRFGGKNFKSSSNVKTYLKSLLSSTKEGSAVDPQYHNFLLDILKLHPDFVAKAKDLKNFAVGRHPEHPESKCFFIVRSDGGKEDFSIAKCLATL